MVLLYPQVSTVTPGVCTCLHPRARLTSRFGSRTPSVGLNQVRIRLYIIFKYIYIYGIFIYIFYVK